MNEALRLYRIAGALLTACEAGESELPAGHDDEKEAWFRIINFWLLRLSAPELFTTSATMFKQQLANHQLVETLWVTKLEEATAGVEETNVPKILNLCASDREILGQTTPERYVRCIYTIFMATSFQDDVADFLLNKHD